MVIVVQLIINLNIVLVNIIAVKKFAPNILVIYYR